MCEKCSKYLQAGCAYCLECGSLLSPNKEASDEPEGMFKHASEDLDLENTNDKINDNKNNNGK